MDPRTPRLLAWISGLAAIALLTLTSSAGAENELVGIDKLTTDQITMVSKTGTAIVGRIEKARDLIQRNDWTGARFEVGKARAELGRVRDVSPSSRIRDKIDAALKALRSSGTTAAQQQLLPLYQELDAQKNVVAVADTRTFVDKAKAKLASGSQDEAENALIEASASADYFALDLPVQATYSRLTTALIALRDKDLARANTELRAAQDSIQVVVAAASGAMGADEDMPAVSGQ